MHTCQGTNVRIRGQLKSQFSLPAVLVPGNRTQGWQPLSHLTHPTLMTQRTVTALCRSFDNRAADCAHGLRKQSGNRHQEYFTQYSWCNNHEWNSSFWAEIWPGTQNLLFLRVPGCVHESGDHLQEPDLSFYHVGLPRTELTSTAFKASTSVYWATVPAPSWPFSRMYFRVLDSFRCVPWCEWSNSTLSSVRHLHTVFTVLAPLMFLQQHTASSPPPSATLVCVWSRGNFHLHHQ